MVKHAADMPVEHRPNMRQGEGTVTLTAAFEKGEYDSRTRLFSRITLPVGASIGYHIHEDEEEFFYFLSGEGELNDNGIPKAVKGGDASVTHNGEGHSLRNTGTQPLELLAVIALCP